MGVHVEQAWQQRAAGAVDDSRRVLGRRARGVDRRDAPLVDVDVGRLAERRGLRVEHADVPDQDRLGQRLRVLLRQLVEVFRLRILLDALELRCHALVTGDHQVAAADVDAGEQRHVVAGFEPDVVRLQPGSQDRKQRDVAFSARGPDARGREPFAPQLAARQRSEPPARFLRRAHDDGGRFRAAVARQVNGRFRQRLAAAFRRRLPARPLPGNRETLVEDRAVGRLAGLAVALEAAVGLQGNVLLDVRPAAVVAIGVAHVPAPVVLDHGLLRAGLLAGVQDVVVERRIGLRGAGDGERQAGDEFLHGDSPVSCQRISDTGIMPAALTSSKQRFEREVLAELVRALAHQVLEQELAGDVARAVARLAQVELLLEAEQVEVRAHPAARRPLDLEGLGLLRGRSRWPGRRARRGRVRRAGRA